MKRLFAILFAFAATVAFGATTVPVQLLSPSGSSSGQAIVSTGSSSAPAWTTVANAGANTNITSLAGLTSAIPVASVGSLINVQVFTSSGTYTPTTGTKSVVVVDVGGGGAGGGAPLTSSSQQSAGGGGGAGAWTIGRFTSGFSGATVTIGAAGTGASGANGGSGGSTSFGSLLVAGGGTGGSALAAFSTATDEVSSAGIPGTVSTAGNIASSSGQYGQPVTAIIGIAFAGGIGGSGPWGSGGVLLFQTTGGAASGHGAGGGGTYNGVSQAAQTGGAASGGIVIVYEYD